MHLLNSYSKKPFTHIIKRHWFSQIKSGGVIKHTAIKSSNSKKHLLLS